MGTSTGSLKTKSHGMPLISSQIWNQRKSRFGVPILKNSSNGFQTMSCCASTDRIQKQRLFSPSISMGKLRVLTAGLSIGKAKEDVLGRFGPAKKTVGQGSNP